VEEVDKEYTTLKEKRFFALSHQACFSMHIVIDYVVANQQPELAGMRRANAKRAVYKTR